MVGVLFSYGLRYHRFKEFIRNRLQYIFPQAVYDAVEAGGGWNVRRDVPDIANFADLAHAPDRVVQIIKDRVSSQRLTGQVHRMPVAKPDPSKSSNPLRWAAVLDPYTEVALRLHFTSLVGRVEATARDIGDDVVAAGRVEQHTRRPAAWCHLEPSYLLDRQNDTIDAALTDPDFYALGQADIRSCYPSLTPDVIAAGLEASGVPDLLIDPVVTTLTELTELWGITGLPVGPEWSPVLANAALFALDKDLIAAGVQHLRWIDDVAFLFTGFGWSEAHQVFEASLARLGLEPNYQKFNYTKNPAEALAAFTDPEVARLRALEDHPHEQLSHARGVHAEMIATGQVTPSRLRYLLGLFGGTGITDAVQPVVEEPDLLAVAPAHYGRYLTRMLTDGAIDREWIIHRATMACTDRDAVGQLHLLKACVNAGLDWSRPHSDALWERAQDERAWSPLRSWAVTAYGRTSAFKPSHAVDGADTTGDSHVQRAWALALRRREGRKTRKAAERLARAHPESAPAARMSIEAA